MKTLKDIEDYQHSTRFECVDSDVLRQAAKEWITKWEDEHKKNIKYWEDERDKWVMEYENGEHQTSTGLPTEMNSACEWLISLKRNGNPKQKLIDEFKHFFNLEDD